MRFQHKGIHQKSGSWHESVPPNCQHPTYRFHKELAAAHQLGGNEFERTVKRTVKRPMDLFWEAVRSLCGEYVNRENASFATRKTS